MKINKNLKIVLLISGLIIFNLIFIAPFLILKDKQGEGRNSENNISEKIEITPEKKIVWDENIKFTKCDDYSNYDRNNDESRKLFYKSNEVSILTEKLNKDFEWWPYSDPFVQWYCKNDDWKFIFWFTSVSLIQLWKFDKELNLIELTDYIWKFDQHINYPWKIRNRDYWDRSLEKYYSEFADSKEKINWFWKKNWNNIPFSIYWQWMTWTAESAPWFFQMWKAEFLKENTVRYCDKWLTKNWKLTVCFVNIFYNFNFIENKITEEKICTYYVNDNWEIKTLENCKEL